MSGEGRVLLPRVYIFGRILDDERTVSISVAVVPTAQIEMSVSRILVHLALRRYLIARYWFVAPRRYVQPIYQFLLAQELDIRLSLLSPEHGNNPHPRGIIVSSVDEPILIE